jgi:hypothetical protein
MIDIILGPLGIITQVLENVCGTNVRLVHCKYLVEVGAIIVLLSIRLRLQTFDILVPTLLLVLKVQEPLETITLLLETTRRTGVTGKQLGIDLKLSEIVDVHLCMTYIPLKPP